VSSADDDLTAIYRRYHACCNAHEFDRLDEFVADDVEVNGEPQGLTGYVAGLRAVVRAFPDYAWQLHRFLVDAPWVSAHFFDSGTHRGTWHGVPATGRRVHTQEFALYRWAEGRIVEVWVTADDRHALEQLR
jgi:predicted ester cyclase